MAKLMWTFLATALIFALSGVEVEGAQCCAGYRDAFGTYHETQLCQNYCCLNPSLSDYVKCCDNSVWEAPSFKRTDDCLKSWIQEHIWAPIVGGAVLVGLILLCTCCCCCGCCRRKPAPVVIQTTGGPQTTVAMQQAVVNAPAPMNHPAHYGYDQ